MPGRSGKKYKKMKKIIEKHGEKVVEYGQERGETQ